MAAGDVLEELSLTELLASARALTAEIASRVSNPRLLGAVDQFPDGPEVDRSEQWGLFDLTDFDADARASGEGESASHEPVPDGPVPGGLVPNGSLPVIQLRVEELGRQIETARTALAGHVDRVFDDAVQRREVLGVPAGKSAYRNSAEYLCHHLRIRRSEARRRIGRAVLVMARDSLDQTRVLPPEMPVLAGVVHEGHSDIASVDVIIDTLVAARKDAALAGAEPRLVDGLIRDGERVLATQARDTDPDTMKKACHYWRQRFDALANPDGAEPTEVQVQAVQGLFYRGLGAANLHEWSLLAGDAQHEILKTIASEASSHRRNPGAPPASSHPSRGDKDGVGDTAGSGSTDGACSLDSDSDSDGGGNVGSDGNGTVSGDSDGHGRNGRDGLATSARPDGWARAADASDALDTRSRGQRELDGLISALTGALSLTAPDSGGGLRPQVLVTIDYQTLAGQLEEAASTGTLISQAAYTGPVTPQTIRQLACDADLIPVVLGGKGEVLDVGRSQRLFPRRLRRAITARDGGCAAPACSIPAPWCEVHHIEHWEHGGPTSVDNGVLLCSHHHHAVHSGSWQISVREGIPWFIPARHHDPGQRPRRNHYWRSDAEDEAA